MSEEKKSSRTATIVSIVIAIITCFGTIVAALIPEFIHDLRNASAPASAIAPTSLPVPTNTLAPAPQGYDISGYWEGRLDGNSGPLLYSMSLVQIQDRVEGTAAAADSQNPNHAVLFSIRGDVQEETFHFEEYEIRMSEDAANWCLIHGYLTISSSGGTMQLAGTWESDPNDANAGCRGIVGKLTLTKTK